MKNKSVSVFWLLVLAIAVIGYMVLSVQYITRASFVKNEGIQVSAEDIADISPMELGIVNQNNGAWAMKIMCSDIKLRICEYGSQLCCMSSIFRLFDIHKNPDTLYDQFFADGLYSEGDTNILSDAVYEIIDLNYQLAYESPKLNTDITFSSQTIINLLDRGIPVMVRTSHPLIERYWVVVTGIQDGEFVIMDPLADEYSLLSEYDNKVFEIMYFT